MPGQSQAQTAFTGALEEILVTATRVETNLQQTPMSIHALTGESLELAGIETGRELGIMVPNIVANPSVRGEREANIIVRGLPGVATYVDGVGFGDWGFLQRRFVEIERVEVLRGPQGTHFGNSTNGGAIQVITRKPVDEFRVRAGIELGEFSRRTTRLSVDAPISERLKTKWTVATDENDGFLESLTAPLCHGGRDDAMFRADVLWEPTGSFSLRLTVSREDMRSTDPRIIRLSNREHPNYIARNVLAGNPDFLSLARANDPAFPDPPFALAGDRFTPETHEPGFPGGRLGEWQTMSGFASQQNSDIRTATLTLNWDIGEHWSLESLSNYGDPDFETFWDRDATEFEFYKGYGHSDPKVKSQELHLTSNHFDGRLRTLIGFWYLQREWWERVYRWVDWDFAVPSMGPAPPPPNMSAIDYVRAWGRTVGNGAVANYFPATGNSFDFLNRGKVSERAFFSELTIGLVDRLDLTLGVRVAEHERGHGFGYLPGDAFRSAVPGTSSEGDPFAVGVVLGGQELADLGTASAPRVSLAYEPTGNVYLYVSYAEGLAHGGVVNHPLVPEPIVLDPEVVKTREIGLRSDWLGGRLRFNATYFDSIWDGLVVPKQLDDPNNPGQPLPFVRVPSSDGVGKSEGLELELYYLPAERWEIDFAVGLLDTAYLDIGDPTPDGFGLQPGTPFAYAPDLSYSLGARYRLPLANGGHVLFSGNYGWMDDYVRGFGREVQTKNPDGSIKPEPAYGILNAQIVYRPGGRNWQLSVFGTNLTDEWYVNGGEDWGLFLGYDFATIGRSREIGIGLQFALD